MIVPVSSDIIATEPIADRLDASGWLGGEPVTNSRLTLRYTRRTTDGRLLFGRAGVHLGFAGRVTRRFHQDTRKQASLVAEMEHFVPAASGARVTHAWAGPVDRSVDGLPVMGRLPCRGAQLLYATGFSGNGVAPAVIAGNILTALTLSDDSVWSRSCLVDRSLARFPPNRCGSWGE